jgi:hypothetical protein
MIAFTRNRPGVHDEATDKWSGPTTSVITGEGFLMSGDPEQYAAQELVLETTPLIGFTPSPYPLAAFTEEFVLPGDQTTINDVVFTVAKLLKVVALDGYVIYSRIAVRR